MAFLLVKIAAKFAGVLPAALRYVRPHAVFTTLLMSTGLTFGTISSLYGLNAGIIDRQQFTILIGAVIGSAVGVFAAHHRSSSRKTCASVVTTLLCARDEPGAMP